MGNTVSTGKGPPQGDVHTFLQEFPELTFSKLIGNGKFLKTVVCKGVEHGDCVVKVYRSPDPEMDPQVIQLYSQRLALLRRSLRKLRWPSEAAA